MRRYGDKQSAIYERRRQRDRRAVSALVWLLIASGCATPVQQYGLNDLALSCDEANRAVYKTLTTMGFTVTEFAPAAMGRRGEARATRDATETGGGQQKATVTIDCGPTGTAVDAREDGKWLGQLEFKRGFYLSFTSGLAMAARRKEMEETAAAAATPPPSVGLRVLVEPLRGEAAKIDFELDMAAAGVLPVRVEVKNPTPLRYEISADDVRLTRTDRERVAPLSRDSVAARISGATDAATGKPLTTLSRAQIDQRLEQMGFTATQVGPNSEAKGYLYFPLAEYTRARVVLTDAETEETEGFVVEF